MVHSLRITLAHPRVLKLSSQVCKCSSFSPAFAAAGALPPHNVVYIRTREQLAHNLYKLLERHLGVFREAAVEAPLAPYAHHACGSSQYVTTQHRV
jgi:hypothetical protein